MNLDYISEFQVSLNYSETLERGEGQREREGGREEERERGKILLWASLAQVLEISPLVSSFSIHEHIFIFY